MTLAGEQGLGDTLFFLRFAPALKAAGATLRFAGDPRLHSLLARTGLFESFLQDASEATPDAHCILVADLPSIAPDPFAPSLHIAPQPGRVSRWRAALQAAGPRPWIGVTWRAGTPPVEVAHALYKSIPLASLCAAVAPLGGTVFALQRYPEPGEIDAAGRALGAAVHDFSRASDDLEDVLALLSLLDRHIGVSNTNMHLVAATGATADVLVPFPPEWRWRTAGTSPWFPGFRIHRQDRERDWTAALRGLAP